MQPLDYSDTALHDLNWCLAQLCAKFHTLGKSLLYCSNAVNSMDATRLLKACVFGEHCSLIYSQARRAVWL